MNDVVIQVEDLGKLYRIGRARERHDTLRDAISAALRAPWSHVSRLVSRAPEQSAEDTIWALRDVSFEVRRGEVLGIIGRNGAGKSTLLKVLCSITEPTAGRTIIRGRVSSLLEVGTGFHPELTGRENVYLNGAILGMRKAEIDRKFDDIVDFAEIDTFMDTPVKRYSSGMYVRLAFAVAAHLEPEVLLIDEVLAVGDVGFQRKCLGKMDDVAHEGRTVLFVSHNMAAVQRLCPRAILLQDGAVLHDGETAKTVDLYLRSLDQLGSQRPAERTDRGGTGQVRVTGVAIKSRDGDPSAPVTAGSQARFAFRVNAVPRGLACSFTVYGQRGEAVANFNCRAQSREDRYDQSLGDELVCEVDELLLVPGRYRVNVALSCNGELQDHLEAAAFFDVEAGLVRGRPVTGGGTYGSVAHPHRWILPEGIK